MTGDEGADELGPLVAVVRVAHAADDDVVEDALGAIALGEMQDGFLAAGLHVDQVHARRDLAEVAQGRPDRYVVVGWTGGQALRGAGDA